MWALSIAPPFSLPVVAGAGGYFAPHIRAYIRRSGAPTHIGAMVAVKDRRNGALDPYAHLQQADITLESVQASPMLWDPVRHDETCPSSDGACAVIIGDEQAAEASQEPVAWIRAAAMRSEPTMFAGKDHVNPRAGAEAAAALWRQAGITDPLEEFDVAEIYVPFSWYEPMWLENLGFAAPGEGWRLTEAGETRIGGRAAGQPVRRRAQLQPDRRVRPAPVRRGGAAGHGQGGRPSGSRSEHRARARLRRRLPVLLHVGGAEHAALGPVRSGIGVVPWCTAGVGRRHGGRHMAGVHDHPPALGVGPGGSCPPDRF